MSSPDLNAVYDAIAKAAEQHRADEVRTRADDMLVDGRLLMTEPGLEQLKRDAAVADGEINLPAWALISVLAIPDDGAPHDIGNGKVAVVSPLDHKTIFVMPAEFLGPRSMRITEEAREIRRPGGLT